MLYRIEEVLARTKYRVWIRFADGAEGEVDLSPLVGKGVFEGWSDPAEFEKVYIDQETGTISWPGGLDLAPDRLYRDITSVASSHS